MKIAFYLRLSESDGDLGKEGKDVSNSIENQRLLLHTFLEARDDLAGDVTEYIDDGYSGTNFNRPSFRQMIENAKKGMIDVILVKDLSRLGRDYIVTGDYIEQIFPMLNVRFIAVNNNYDSKEHNNGTMSFDVAVNNLVNTFYSRDLSKKLTSSHSVKWKNGISTSGQAPYGYKKSRAEKGKLVIDPEAAVTVRFIFEKAAKGFSSKEISMKLNEAQIPTPRDYMMEHNLIPKRASITPERERLWDCTKVTNIIRRYDYTGALVIGRRKPLSIGDTKCRMKPKSEWTVIDNANEPIVSRELYNEANLAITKPKAPDFIIKQNYPLKGKLRCGNCHHTLTRVISTYKEYYLCPHGAMVGKYSDCCKDQYPAQSIERTISLALMEHIRILQEIGVAAAERAKSEVHQAKAINRHIEEKRAKLLEEKIRQYEFYASGIITKEAYLRKREDLCKQIDLVKEETERQTRIIEENEELLGKTSRAVKLSKKYSNQDPLPTEAIETFIEKVFVYDSKHIEIVFRFEDLLHLEEEKMRELV